jgi:uncharacterized protein DUF6285
MMRDQPTGDQLLETAREILREEVLPILPANKRYAALMIANAMAIAMRELRCGDRHDRAELTGLGEIFATAEPLQALSGAALASALDEGNRSLGQLIRSGGADVGQAHAAVWRHLLEATRNRVSISNPKYLDGGAG